MISADTFCCTVRVTSHLKDVKHFSSKSVSWHSQKEVSRHGKQAQNKGEQSEQSIKPVPSAVSVTRWAWTLHGGAGSSGSVGGVNGKLTNYSDVGNYENNLTGVDNMHQQSHTID